MASLRKVARAVAGAACDYVAGELLLLLVAVVILLLAAAAGCVRLF